MSLGNDDRLRVDDGDDLPPSGAEARAQRRSTSLPLVWLAVGLVLIVGFILAITQGGSLFHAQASGPAPVRGASAPGA
jgi:hypothetical protein